MKKFFKKNDSLLWAILLLVIAFSTAPQLSPLIGATVFTALFTLAVALVKKHFDDRHKPQG